MGNTKLVKRIKIAVCAMSVLLIFLWMFSVARILINVQGAGTGEITYKLAQSPKLNTKTIQSYKAVIHPRVKAGNYEVTVSQGNKSFFTVVKTGHLFASTTASGRLEGEKKRTFIGNNPSSCLFYSEVLYSYTCSGPYSSLMRHVPATSTTPTYTQKVSSSGLDGVVEGMVKINAGTVVLLHQVSAEGPGAHILYLLDGNLKLISQKELVNLDSSGTYALANYLDGFFLYNASLSQTLYYMSVQAAPTTLNLPSPSIKGLKPITVTVGEDSISTVYTTSSSSTKEIESRNITNEVYIYKAGKSDKYVLKGLSVSSVTSCGQSNLCVLSNHMLMVYDKNNKLLYSVNGVNSLLSEGNDVLLVRDDGVLNFNVGRRQGYLDYSYGTYNYCGVSPVDASSYILCLSSGDSSVAVLINRQVDDKDSIDKKVQELGRQSYITNVSTYGNYVFVTPKLGDLVYSPTLKSFDYDAKTKASVKALIEAEVEKLDLKKDGYTVVNTAG